MLQLLPPARTYARTHVRTPPGISTEGWEKWEKDFDPHYEMFNK